jgi:hypothetical protein
LATNKGHAEREVLPGEKDHGQAGIAEITDEIGKDSEA